MGSADREAANVDRARVYRALALLFRPERDGALETLRRREIPNLRAALVRLGDDDAARQAERLAGLLRDAEEDGLRRDYEQTFGPSGGLRCPPAETSHVPTTPQEGLVRTFQMADVAGFYRAFGVEVTPGTERPDHVAAELEFMHLLALKEALALQQEGEGEHAAVCRDAARSFLEDHLGRFAPLLAEQLDAEAASPVFAVAGRLLEGFVAAERQRLSPAAGHEPTI